MILPFFLSFGLYITWRNNNGGTCKYVLSIIFLILSVFSREDAVVLPFVIIAWEILNPYRRGLKAFSRVIPYIAIAGT